MSDKVDLNTATADEIASKVTMIGRAKAEAIVKYREERGNFNSIEELKHVPGFGDKMVENLSTFCTV